MTPYLRRTARSVGAAVLAGVLLCLSACGIDTPQELQPAERGERRCPTLAGTWDVSSSPGVARLFPGDELPVWLADSLIALRVAPADADRVDIDFLADTDAIVAAAEALRRSDPAAYARWRKHVEADAPNEAILADGPTLSMRRQFGSGTCTDGWLSLGVDRHPPDEKERHLTGIELSRNPAGALLVRSHYSQTKSTNFNFFGQNVSWERDAGSNIAVFPARTDAQALSTRRLRDLAIGVDPAALTKWRAQAPDRIVRVNARLLASLPPSVMVEGMEVVNLDVTNAKAVPDHFRIAMTASCEATTHGDALFDALQGLPEVSGLELVRQEDAGHGLRRTAVEFEYRE